MAEKTLPFYQLVINDNADKTGVDYVAMVDEPAIQLQWQSFNKAEKQSFKITDNERHIVSGALMVADLPIYRNNEQLGEHFITFTPKTIEQIVTKFFKNKNSSNVNLMHEPSAIVDGVTMIESLIIDKSRGITAPEGYGNLTEGSWFGSFKVENDAVWNEIKNGTFKGFSVEGIFDYAIERQISEPQVSAIEQVVFGTKKGNEYLLNEQNFIMSLLEKIIGKDAVEKLQKFMDANPTAAPTPPAAPDPNASGTQAIAKDGTVIYTDKDFNEGANLTIDSPTGKIMIPDGEYTIDNGTDITTKDGVIVSVLPTEVNDMNKQIEQAVANANAANAANAESMKAAMETIKGDFAAQTENFKTQIAELKTTASILANAMSELVKSMEQTPAAAPVEKVENKFSKDEKKNEHFNKVSEAIKKFNQTQLN